MIVEGKIPLTGLEPVVSALRGRRVNHLHHSGNSTHIDHFNNELNIHTVLIDRNVARTKQALESLNPEGMTESCHA